MYLIGSPTQWRRIWLGLYVLVIAIFALSIGQYHRKRTGFTILINFGGQFHERKLPAVRDVPHYVHATTPGYDGQFYAQLAVEPLLRDRAIDRALDNPPYRARRILFSWTAYLLGLGRPEWILKAYALQNIVAWLLLALLLVRWLPPTGSRHFAAWVGCLLGFGVIGSVMLALTEGPSLVLLALAVVAVEGGRPWVAAIVMGIAGLGRETNLVGAGAIVDRLPRTRDELLRLTGLGAIMVLPYLFWSLYVRSLYPTFTFSNPAGFSLPFFGYIGKWIGTIGELRTYGLHRELVFCFFALVSITTQVAFLLFQRRWGSPWWRMGAAYTVLFPFLSPIVWAGYPGAAIRVLVPMSIAFNVLIVESRWFWLLVVVGNLSAMQGLHELQLSLLSRLR